MSGPARDGLQDGSRSNGPGEAPSLDAVLKEAEGESAGEAGSDSAPRPGELEHSRRQQRNSTVSKELEPFGKVFEMAMGFTSGGAPGVHPLFEKFNDRHIDKFLDGIQRDDDNAHRLQSTNRYFHLLYTALFLAAFVFLVIYLTPSNKDLLIDFMKLVVVFAGGLGSGFGLKSHLDKKRGPRS